MSWEIRKFRNHSNVLLLQKMGKNLCYFSATSLLTLFQTKKIHLKENDFILKKIFWKFWKKYQNGKKTFVNGIASNQSVLSVLEFPQKHTLLRAPIRFWEIGRGIVVFLPLYPAPLRPPANFDQKTFVSVVHGLYMPPYYHNEIDWETIFIGKIL